MHVRTKFSWVGQPVIGPKLAHLSILTYLPLLVASIYVLNIIAAEESFENQEKAEVICGDPSCIHHL